MIITGVEPFGKKRSRVYLDGSIAFVLYKGEALRYGIEEGAELTQELYDEIVKNVLTKRAKLRCMNLLKSMDRTEYQLRQKLNQGEYPQEAAEAAIAYVKSYGYVDDASYAERYIESRRRSKSRRQIVCELVQRGIAREVIEEAFSCSEPVDEGVMIRKWMEKKHMDAETASLQEKQKMYLFLMRKGFSSDEIRKAFSAKEEI